MPLRVLIADGQNGRREALQAALARLGLELGFELGFEIAQPARDGPEALARAAALRPDLVLLAADLPPSGGLAVAERLAGTYAAVLLSEDAGPEALRRAMRAGVRDLLPWTLPPEELAAALHAVHADSLRRTGPGVAAPGPPNQAARVIAVAGAKGGVGRTTLAVNLAAALAREGDGPTVLLDLHMQFGDAALLLGLTPRRTLADLTRLDPESLDERLLEEHLERHECGLAVLAGAAAPLALDTLSPALLERLLALTGRTHQYIVLDLPPVLHETTLAALARADDVLLVANLFDITTLADSRLWLDALLGAHIRPEALRVVLSRVSARNRLQVADCEAALGLAVDALIPNDGKLVPASVNAGIPFVLSHPNSPPARSVTALACALSAPVDTAPAPPARPKAPFFGAMRREGSR